jgi:hypothetical protein
VAQMGEKRNVCRLFVGGVDWISLAQDRYRHRALVNSVMNLQVP